MNYKFCRLNREARAAHEMAKALSTTLNSLSISPEKEMSVYQWDNGIDLRRLLHYDMAVVDELITAAGLVADKFGARTKSKEVYYPVGKRVCVYVVSSAGVQRLG